jgi:hypothetical protein
MSTSTVVRSVLASCLVFGVGMAGAQDKAPPPKPAAPPASAPAKPAPPAAGVPATAAPAMPAPAPELAEFMKDVLGSWSCNTTFPAGAMGPGSPEVKVNVKVKFSKDQALGGFFYKGEYKMTKSKEMPMAFAGLFYMGYEPASKQVTNVAVDNTGAVSMGVGPLTATTASWSGEGYMMGKKVKTRETMTKDGPKQLTHKMEVDMGKGFQVMGEDVCKK